jgi:tetratricopeptide (TPR) repeat protein
MYRTQLMAELARSDAFDRELARYDELTAEIRHPHHIAFVARFHAMRALWRGRVGEAERLVFDAYEKGQRSDPSYAFAAFSAQLGLLRRLQGRFVELEAPLLQSAERYPVMVSFRSALALLHAMDGRREEASEGFASLAANDFAALLPNDPNHRLNLALLTEVCAALGEREAAQSLAKSLAAYRGRYIAVSTVIAAGCGSRYLGLLAATCGDYDSAEKLFVEAIAVEVRMHADAWLANTQCDYARMLLERRKTGDIQRAEQLLDDAGRLSSSNELEGLQRTITQIRASSF